jgi:hypothetical protein
LTTPAHLTKRKIAMQILTESFARLNDVSLTDETLAHFKPATDAASATMSKSTATQWTGDAPLALYRDITRDLQALAVQLRNSGYLPQGPSLFALTQIPQRLHLAAARFVAESFPAIRNDAPDKNEAEEVLREALGLYDAGLNRSLIALHQVMQSEDEQMAEVARWSGHQGLILAAVQAVGVLFAHIAALSRHIAPKSNPQSRMFVEETVLHLSDLYSTISRCA